MGTSNINATQFISYMENPASITETATGELSKLVTQFPYFQSAHLLYLKGLHKQKSLEYPKQLKITAAYVSDRKNLYELIMQEDLHKQIRLVEELSNEEATDNKIDFSPLEAQILQEAVNASIKLEVSQQREPLTEEDEDYEQGDLAKSTAPIKETKTQNRSGQKTFNEWLRSSAGQSVDDNYEESSDTSKLIDKFIDTAPRVGDSITLEEQGMRQPFFSPQDTARLSLVDDPSFVTETLAGIYEAQGYIDKALKAYNLLSLKYPEKRNTFAARIKELEKQLQK